MSYGQGCGTAKTEAGSCASTDVYTCLESSASPLSLPAHRIHLRIPSPYHTEYIVPVMLCKLCDKIVLRLDGARTSTEVRAYRNIHDLRITASTCAFCKIVFEDVAQLEQPDVAIYCKLRWGLSFFHLLLDQSRITITYYDAEWEQNMHIKCLLNAQETPGYPGGPIAFQWESTLGGLYVPFG